MGEEACPIDPWIVVPDKSQYVDQQTLKLQENPEVMKVSFDGCDFGIRCLIFKHLMPSFDN